MNGTTTTDDTAPATVDTTPAADAPPSTSRPRNPPRKLTMTDKIREARAVNVNKVERLVKRADQLREQLAATVRDLNDARAEIERADAVLPRDHAEQLEAARFAAANGQAAQPA